MKFSPALLFFTVVSSAFALSNSIVAPGQALTRRGLDVCAALDIEIGILGILGLSE
jgi:hypothetical protein